MPRPHLHYHTLASTNDLAKTLGRLTGPYVFPNGLCISADLQTSGRGQFERSWVSPPGGIYFSFLAFSPTSSRLRREEEIELKGLRPFDPVALAHSPDPMGSKGRQPLETSVFPPPLNKGGSRGIFSAEEIPYLIGLQLQSWLSKNFQINTHVKPPNDLLVNGKKLCGILIEKVSRGNNAFWVVGIGLNLNQQLFPETLPDATSMSLVSGKTYDKTAVINELIEECGLWFGA